MYWYLEKGYSFEGHLDEICYVRKICGNLFLQSTKQKRRPLSAEFGKEWRHGETESRHNVVTALKVNAEWLGNALVRCTPGGGTQVQRGVAPALRISRKKGSFFKTSACPRFCKRRVLFCTQVRSMGVKIPLQSTKYTRLWRRVTAEVTGLPSLLPLNKQRIIKSKVKIRAPVHPMSVFC